MSRWFELTYAGRRHRVALAVRLAWAALRGRTLQIEVGGPEGVFHFTGIRDA